MMHTKPASVNSLATSEVQQILCLQDQSQDFYLDLANVVTNQSVACHSKHQSDAYHIKPGMTSNPFSPWSFLLQASLSAKQCNQVLFPFPYLFCSCGHGEQDKQHLVALCILSSVHLLLHSLTFFNRLLGTS